MSLEFISNCIHANLVDKLQSVDLSTVGLNPIKRQKAKAMPFCQSWQEERVIRFRKLL